MICFRTSILLFVLAATTFLGGCRSHKETVSNKSLDRDSVARSEHHRTIAVIDSAIRNIDFSFDTLKINIERPVEYAEAPEVIRLTATRGRVIDRRKPSLGLIRWPIINQPPRLRRSTPPQRACIIRLTAQWFW